MAQVFGMSAIRILLLRENVNRSELNLIGKHLKIKKYYKMKKAELIREIMKELLNSVNNVYMNSR